MGPLIMPGTSEVNGARASRQRLARSYLTHPWAWASGLLAVIVPGLVLLTPTVRQELAISFTRQPDSYMELYFTGTVPVSTAQVAGRQEITVSFAITNHEGHPSQYAYVVRILDPIIISTAERMGLRRLDDVMAVHRPRAEQIVSLLVQVQSKMSQGPEAMLATPGEPL
jgi:hypothetical protein